MGPISHSVLLRSFRPSRWPSSCITTLVTSSCVRSLPQLLRLTQIAPEMMVSLRELFQRYRFSISMSPSTLLWLPGTWSQKRITISGLSLPVITLIGESARRC